ncbi:MAG: WXG100 family type VII secretion target [Oscillospiraceae bacterium]|nr:WXG100 family type VII secretion target [Oscillospiraceae bacterium]
MSGQTRVNTSAITAAANNIANLNTGIRNDFNTVETEMNGLASAWRGEASERARAAFSSVRNAYLNDRFSVVDNYVRFLRNQVGDGYVQTETTNEKLADAFK